MFQVETNPARGLLHLTFTQHVSSTQARHCCATAAAALTKLPAGICVFTDLTGLEEMDYSCVPEIQKLMDLCRTHGVAEVVRVIPDPKKDIGFKLLSFFHYGRAVPIRTFKTLAEAKTALAL